MYEGKYFLYCMYVCLYLLLMTAEIRKIRSSSDSLYNVDKKYRKDIDASIDVRSMDVAHL